MIGLEHYLTVAAALQAPVTKVAPIARSGVRRCEISCGDGRARREKRSRVKSALRARRFGFWHDLL